MSNCKHRRTPKEVPRPAESQALSSYKARVSNPVPYKQLFGFFTVFDCFKQTFVNPTPHKCQTLMPVDCFVPCHSSSILLIQKYCRYCILQIGSALQAKAIPFWASRRNFLPKALLKRMWVGFCCVLNLSCAIYVETKHIQQVGAFACLSPMRTINALKH